MENPKKFYIKIYGCLFNYADADRIRTTLLNSNLQETQTPEEADIIIAVTCSVREKAEHKAISFIKKYAEQGKQTILTGCMVRRDFLDTSVSGTKKRLKRLKNLMPNTLFFDVTNLKELDSLINNPNLELELLLKRPFASSYYDDIKPTLTNNSPIATVPIMIGCNEMCTYCIVPQTRGQEKYRPLDSILEEVKLHLQNGKKIIYLLGQIVDKWHWKNYSFLDLLKQITSLPNNFWLSFTSPHPNYITTEILDFMAEEPKLMKHLGLPLQSGSNTVLKAMNRKYTREKYIKIAEYARKHISDLYLTTDIIVGFPPETEEDFQDTLDIVRQLQFDKIFMAKYSPRTKLYKELAHNAKYQAIMEDRFTRLYNLATKIFAKNHKKQVGKTYDAVIIDKKYALNIRNQLVELEETLDQKDIGKFINIKIISGGRRGITGRIITKDAD